MDIVITPRSHLYIDKLCWLIDPFELNIHLIQYMYFSDSVITLNDTLMTGFVFFALFNMKWLEEGSCFESNHYAKVNCTWHSSNLWQQCFCLNVVWRASLVIWIKAFNNPLVEWGSTLAASNRLIAPGNSSTHSFSLPAYSCWASQGGWHISLRASDKMAGKHPGQVTSRCRAITLRNTLQSALWAVLTQWALIFS